MTEYLKACEDEIWKKLAEVCDPEVPVLSVLDLGVVRSVNVVPLDDQCIRVEVVITPTYTGCPAMDMIAMNIRLALLSERVREVNIQTVLSPAWTTEWMTEAGKKKLAEYGIAPPDKKMVVPVDGVPCPQCHSSNTTLLSEFGSTACKSLYQCKECLEPFDYFKCH